MVIDECVAAFRSRQAPDPQGTTRDREEFAGDRVGRSSTSGRRVFLRHRSSPRGLRTGPRPTRSAVTDWTRTEDRSGSLIFTPGYLVEAVDPGAWLVIDELNRADIDKAIGQFFSVLSGQPAVLPFLDQRGRRIGVSPPGTQSRAPVEVRVPENWRLITTMNERDRGPSLQPVREAFMRRFAVIEVPTPTEDTHWAWILAEKASA